MSHETSLKKLQDIFANSIYVVPDYQRGYSWEEHQWQDLIDDIELLTDDCQQHYTGTIVIASIGEMTDDDANTVQKYEVVDGQQRLTTLSILLCELSRRFREIGSETKAEGIRKAYIHTRQDGEVLPRLSLNRDVNEYYINAIINQNENVFFRPEQIESEKRLKAAMQFFKKYFDNYKSQENYLSWLETLRKRITSQLFLSVYVLPDKSYVGIIFEVMNNRGKPLTETEKLKNYLMYVCSKLKNFGEKLKDRINNTWKEIYERLMIVEAKDDDFLRYHWLMSQDPDPKSWNGCNSIKQKIDFKRRITSNGDAGSGFIKDYINQYLKSLYEALLAYCDLKSGKSNSYEKYSDNEEFRQNVIEVNNKLIRLSTYSTLVPLLMAARIKSENEPAKYLETLILAEKFAFRVFALQEKRSNAGNSTLYNTAFKLYAGVDDKKKAYNLGDAQWQLEQLTIKYCDKNAFVKSIQEIKNWYEWKSVKYFLFEYELSLAKSKGKSVSIEWNELHKPKKEDTVEHILPRTPKPEDSEYWNHLWNGEEGKYTHDFGNLVLTKDNSSYSNYRFDIKKGTSGQSNPCYAKSHLFSENELCGYPVWNLTSLTERRKKIEDWAIARWKLTVDSKIVAAPVFSEEDVEE